MSFACYLEIDRKALEEVAADDGRPCHLQGKVQLINSNECRDTAHRRKCGSLRTRKTSTAPAAASILASAVEAGAKPLDARTGLFE